MKGGLLCLIRLGALEGIAIDWQPREILGLACVFDPHVHLPVVC